MVSTVDSSIQIVYEIAGYVLSEPSAEDEISSHVVDASSAESGEQVESSVVCVGEHHPCCCLCHEIIVLEELGSNGLLCGECDCFYIHQGLTPTATGPDLDDTFMDDLDEFSVEEEIDVE